MAVWMLRSLEGSSIMSSKVLLTGTYCVWVLVSGEGRLSRWWKVDLKRSVEAAMASGWTRHKFSDHWLMTY